MRPILLLGRCGLERLARPLRAAIPGVDVVVAGWTQVELAERLDPALVYVDLYDWDRIAPLVSAAVVGAKVEVDPREIEGMRAVVDALRGRAVVYRGLRRPLGGAFGPAAPLPADLRDALDLLEAVTRDERVLDVAGTWARHGIVPDEVAHGLGHGEAAVPAPGGADPAGVEARALHALWHARVHGPVKCVVVDLDDTLVHGEIVDAAFASRNPAYQPEGEDAGGPLLEGWWRLRRGLHEALRVVQARGIVLALATRNDPEVVARRFRKRPALPTADAGMYGWMYDDLPPDRADAARLVHPTILDRIALGPDDFVHIEAGFGPKSEMCRAVAEALGIGLDALAFLDDSAFEREEVRRNAPAVRVLDVPVAAFRDELLHGPGFVAWDRTDAAARRAASYRSRAAVVRAARAPAESIVSIEDFLRSLDIRVSVRAAVPGDLPRARELLQRAHQLDLTGERPTLEDAGGVWVAACRDRLADHGLVAVGVFRDGRLAAWVCSCRVLPHRVAGTLLARMLALNPGAAAAYVPTACNAATMGLLEEGASDWVRVE